MSHELRTPLNAIIGYSELMTRHPERFGTERAKDPLERILRAGRHLLNLINDLLDMAKIEAGKTSFRYEDVDVAALVRDAVETTRSLAEQTGNAVSVHAPADLPPLRTDPKRLTQVVLNLLSNACKFTERGRIDISIAPTHADDRQWLEIAVADTGVGIPEPDLPFVFERFYRAKRSRAANPGGSGLGLSIVKWIVEAHKGSVGVESVVGKGSTFTVRLPVI
jgi:signal transduction histidine kinase